MLDAERHLGAPFVTSSYSHPGDCVAVARPAAGPVAVLDSKNPRGPRLTFSPQAWTAFLSFAARATV